MLLIICIVSDNRVKKLPRACGHAALAIIYYVYLVKGYAYLLFSDC